MPKMQVNCPQCRQPLVADVQQLFDVNTDPTAKQRLLSGAYNLIQCQVCGFQGNLSTLVIYHDPEKELLLSFVPAEIGLPRNEQERIIGGLINQVINALPQEKRKGYLFNVQSTLTMQGLVERVLEADGITREMIQAQQQRLSLLQRLASAKDEATRVEIARQEDEIIDQEFFMLLNKLGEAAMAGGDRESAQQLVELQRSLLPVTTYGQQLKAQSAEIETAMKDLQNAGQNLTRERMLELLEKAPNETRLNTLVSLARPALDYSFFQLLSERIDRARGDGRDRLVELRTKLLDLTQEIDRQVEAHRQESHELIEALLKTDRLEEAIGQVLPAIDEIFIKELDAMLKEARSKGDFDRSGKLQQIADLMEKAQVQPPEVALVQEYLELESDESRQAFLDGHKETITQEFLDLLANFSLQVQSSQDKQLAEHVKSAHRLAMRFNMKRNLASG